VHVFVPLQVRSMQAVSSQVTAVPEHVPPPQLSP
jgi:hypothetical protein